MSECAEQIFSGSEHLNNVASANLSAELGSIQSQLRGINGLLPLSDYQYVGVDTPVGISNILGQLAPCQFERFLSCNEILFSLAAA